METRIVYAAVLGSRAWNLHHQDSDYDNRYVFIRPVAEYLTLGKQPDRTITTADSVGWDILKHLGLLAASNIGALEWLYSPLVQHDSGYRDDALALAEEHFDPSRAVRHYAGLSKSNYLRYIESGKQPSVKKYANICRGLLMARWVYDYGVMAPLDIDKLKLSSPITIDSLVYLKRTNRAEVNLGLAQDLNRWIMRQFEFFRYASMPDSKPVTPEPFLELARDFILNQ